MFFFDIIYLDRFYTIQKATLVSVYKKIQTGLLKCNFIKKETLAQVFSCEFCEIFKSTFFYGAPLVAASDHNVDTFLLLLQASVKTSMSSTFLVLAVIWLIFFFLHILYNFFSSNIQKQSSAFIVQNDIYV